MRKQYDIKPYENCATRLEGRGSHPPTREEVTDLIEGLRLAGMEAGWHSAVDPASQPLFPSKIFPDHHPEASLEAFHHLLEEAHTLGIPMLSWHSLNRGGGVLRSYPEWRVELLLPDGVELDPKWVRPYACISSPYGKLLPQFAAEVVRDVGFDGLWFDGSTLPGYTTNEWIAPACVCEFCRERFRSDTALNLPEKVAPDDRTFKEWIRWRYDVLMEVWQACVDAVTAVRPDAVVAFNNYRRRVSGGWHTGIPLRRLGWDCMMSGELDNFPHQADFQIKMHRAYGCARGEETWWPMCDHWFLWVPDHDPLPAIQAHLGAISAGGAACMGVGVPLRLFSPLLQTVQNEVGRRVKFNGGEPVSYAAIWCSQNHQDFGCEQPLGAWDHWHGANEICRHGHLQTAVVFDDHIEAGGVAEYSVLLMGQTRCVSVAQAESLQRYVESGGVLVACGEAGILNEWGELHAVPVLDSLLGTVARRAGVGNPTLEIIDEQLRKAAGAYVTYPGPFVVAEPTQDVELLADVVEHPFGGWDGMGTDNKPSPRAPGLWLRRVGQGIVVWTGVDLFTKYLHAPTPQARRLFHHVITHLRQPKVEVDGPMVVTVNTRIREDGIWMIHLHNNPGTAYAYPVPPTGRYTHSAGEVLPVRDLRIKLNTIKARAAVSGVSGQSFQVTNDGHAVAVPELLLHDVILIEPG